MGCDIHEFVERRGIDKNGVACWRATSGAMGTDRNYALFTLLAGVRHQVGMPIIDTPRGLPDSCSSEIREMAAEDSGGIHSVSYLYYRELAEVDLSEKVKFYGEEEDIEAETVGEICVAFFNWLKSDCEKYNRDLDNTRLVFWFDS